MIELMVVISIISLLSSIVLVSLKSAVKRAKEVRVKVEMGDLTNYINAYYGDNNQYPPSEDDTTGGKDIDVYGLGSGFISQLVTGGYLSEPIMLQEDIYISAWYILKNSNVTNISYRTMACGATPEAQAVLIFWLKTGLSPDFRVSNFFGANAICFY